MGAVGLRELLNTLNDGKWSALITDFNHFSDIGLAAAEKCFNRAVHAISDPAVNVVLDGLLPNKRAHSRTLDFTFDDNAYSLCCFFGTFLFGVVEYFIIGHGMDMARLGLHE